MRIEPLEPLKIRLPSGEIRVLVPGEPVDLPVEQAHTLLTKAAGRVRVVLPAAPTPGCWIEYSSPLFGNLQAEVLSVSDGNVSIWYPLTEQLTVIPSAWITRVSDRAPTENKKIRK
jgi:hypothetical protein